jgi:hypothetical protein
MLLSTLDNQMLESIITDDDCVISCRLGAQPYSVNSDYRRHIWSHCLLPSPSLSLYDLGLSNGMFAHVCHSSICE